MQPPSAFILPASMLLTGLQRGSCSNIALYIQDVSELGLPLQTRGKAKIATERKALQENNFHRVLMGLHIRLD